MKRNILIGIAGKANSGKDTVASMIEYIYRVGTSANYTGWIVKNNLLYTDVVTHFADPLKECVSIMFNIDKSVFYDRKYKDEYFYIFNERRFIDYQQANKSYNIIEHSDLDYKTLSELIFQNPKSCIKLRTLLQYIGTDICRKYINEDLWINSTLNKAIDISKNKGVCIIGDVHFENESDAIRHRTKGIVIKLVRGNDTSNHSSENINFECDYEIENNGTLQQLFYKILEIIQNL